MKCRIVICLAVFLIGCGASQAQSNEDGSNDSVRNNLEPSPFIIKNNSDQPQKTTKKEKVTLGPFPAPQPQNAYKLRSPQKVIEVLVPCESDGRCLQQEAQLSSVLNRAKAVKCFIGLQQGLYTFEVGYWGGEKRWRVFSSYYTFPQKNKTCLTEQVVTKIFSSVKGDRLRFIIRYTPRLNSR